MKKMGEKQGIALLLIAFPCILYSASVFCLLSYSTSVGVMVKPIYYLHQLDISGVTPAGKLMNSTRAPVGQSETTYHIAKGASVYFYTPALTEGSVESGNWTLYIWASTATMMVNSTLTVSVCLVYSNGTTKTSVGNTTDIVIYYSYSEQIVIVSGLAATIASGDMIQLELFAQSGVMDDPMGMAIYYDGYGSYQTLGHETRLRPP